MNEKKQKEKKKGIVVLLFRVYLICIGVTSLPHLSQ